MRDFNIHQNKTVTLKYVAPAELDAYVAQCGDRVACVVGFGSGIGVTPVSGVPQLWVDTPVSGGDAIYEVWTSNKPVTQFVEGPINGAGSEDVFFGRISVPFTSSKDLSETALQVYCRIFDFLQDSGYPNLIRVWNYFPGINVVEDRIERYRSFSLGRHEAFVR